MPSVRYIRWQDPGLWPSVRNLIPPNRTVITDRAEADAHFATLIAATHSEHWKPLYTTLWHAALDFGYQPNGLLIVNLSSLAAAINRDDITAAHAKQLGRDCRTLGVWTYIPGKLKPALSAPGRHRCYLITKPEDTTT